MKSKLKLKILKKWIENPELRGSIPESLENEITDKAFSSLVREVKDLRGIGLEDYARKLESDIRERKKEAREKNAHQRNKWIFRITIATFIVLLLSTLNSTFWDKSQEEGFASLNESISELKPIKHDMEFKVDMWRMGQDEAMSLCKKEICVDVAENPFYHKQSYYYFEVRPRAKKDFPIEKATIKINCDKGPSIYLLTRSFISSKWGDITPEGSNTLIFNIDDFNNLNEPRLKFFYSYLIEDHEKTRGIPESCYVAYVLNEQETASIENVDINYRGNDYPR